MGYDPKQCINSVQIRPSTHMGPMKKFKALFVHPSALMSSKVFLRLEPIGCELVAAACKAAGYDVRLLDLQIFSHKDYFRILDEWKPDAIGFSLNYLPNVPEVVDLAKETKRKMPGVFFFVGGHSASFVAKDILNHAEGAIDCVVRGEGEGVAPRVLEAAADDRKRVHELPGVVSLDGEGPHAEMVKSIDDLHPARELTSKRKSYFIGVLDPAASVEFTRGCPWDCVFCSAWTFYGRSYRKRSPESAAEEMARIKEPGVFLVDDVCFIEPEHGFAIGRELEKRNVKKEYYLETRGDVLLRNKEVFKYWRKLGLEYMFLGLEAIDDEGLKANRKRTTAGKNLEALEFTRKEGITVALNIIADPSWDKAKFAAVREWSLSVPEIVSISVNTPYPGTESWLTESREFSTRDYRLFDVQHAVMPTKMSLEEFYRELVNTQKAMTMKYMGWRAALDATSIAAKLLMRGQTNFVKMLFKFDSVYNAERQIAEHREPVKYEMSMPQRMTGKVDRSKLYIHPQELVKLQPQG
ncbi:Fe-S protein, radical SAM family [Candidatus Koribacter versatilis Ellin345]|uniref:Fe-S protein, radical SAM family n=2 Tax=Candidatus Korobacter versatilis TaxID=658062 RepID=Q1IM61_KORVE|nr:Fe-S protein, radical SAM family [Candidatus Koribacter versatilis Ellin345]